MPIYEYQCQECGQVTEELQRFDDPPLETCRECGGPMRKLVSAPAFQFKGSGWYVTDYADKGKGKGSSEEKASGKASDGPSSGTKGEAKAEKSSDKAPAAKAATAD